MKPFHQRIAVSIVFCAALVTMVVSCGQTAAAPVAVPSPLPTVTVAPSATVTPPSPTATAVTVRPTATTAAVNVAPTPAVQLKTENFEFTVPVTEDDLDPIIPAIRNLDGVTDVVGGGNSLQVTYDPTKLSHKRIADTIAGYGLHVKE